MKQKQPANVQRFIKEIRFADLEVAVLPPWDVAKGQADFGAVGLQVQSPQALLNGRESLQPALPHTVGDTSQRLSTKLLSDKVPRIIFGEICDMFRM